MFFSRFVILSQRIESYWMVLKKQKAPLKFIIARVLMKTQLSKFITLYRDGYKIRFFPTTLSASLWIDPNDRFNDELFFRKYLRGGDNVVDVGSNIGTLTLAAASIVGEEGKVVSIEAHPRTFAFLLKNINLNPFKNIIALNIAVGNEGGYVNFSNSKSDDINRVLENSGGIQVPIFRLDEIIGRELKIRLLKIDVEGYEKFVILGTEKILKNVDCIFFESWEEHFKTFGYSTIELLALMEEWGLRVFRISDGKLEKMEHDHKSSVCENLIAIRNVDNFVSETTFELPD